jgi:hypothetical protein
MSSARSIFSRDTASAKLVAERSNGAIVLIQHLNKTLQQMKAIYRVSGSMAFAALARSVLAVTPDSRA